MAQSMLLVIINISTIMMAFVILIFSMTLLGLRKMDKFPFIGMQNVMCNVVGMEHKQNTT
jgi:hypothetical protein